ncbi:MAG: serine protein kinase, partial [Phycisphaerae bacterium]
MPTKHDIHSIISGKIDLDQFREQHWEGSFDDYLQMVIERPRIARSAFQYLYDMIVHFGTERFTRMRESFVRYHFFSDPIEKGRDAIFGLEPALMSLVDFFRSAAHGYGTESRILLLHGPVGSSKSTIVRLLKKGLEYYSKLEEGSLYTFVWKVPGKDGEMEVHLCPMHEEPLRLIPADARSEALELINKNTDELHHVRVEGDLDPFCRKMYNDLLLKYDGDWSKVMDHIVVRRFILSEKDRRGIGTFQPRDEKNQDSTELTGDINYRKIAEYGSDSDPRAFNFDGELNIGNRGLVEFIEMLKLDVAFLYDLLGASQEHSIKPKKFAQTDIDEVIIGHTNEPEYKKLQSNELME